MSILTPLEGSGRPASTVKKEKVQRLADAQFLAGQTPELPKLQLQLRALKLDNVELETGRPRTEAYLVYLFLMLRGSNGGSVTLDVVESLARKREIQVEDKNEKDRLDALTEFKNLLAIALERDQARDILRTMHIQACLYASVRNKRRKLDLAGIPTCLLVF